MVMRVPQSFTLQITIVPLAFPIQNYNHHILFRCFSTKVGFISTILPNWIPYFLFVFIIFILWPSRMTLCWKLYRQSVAVNVWGSIESYRSEIGWLGAWFVANCAGHSRQQQQQQQQTHVINKQLWCTTSFQYLKYEQPIYSSTAMAHKY